jgi:hypothetical protein
LRIKLGDTFSGIRIPPVGANLEIIFSPVSGKENTEEVIHDGKRVGILFVVPTNRDGELGPFFRVRVKADWNITHEQDFRDIRDARNWLESKLRERFSIEEASQDKELWRDIPEVEEGRPRTGQMTSNEDWEKENRANWQEVLKPPF